MAALGDSWTPTNLLACGGQSSYCSHKDQIPGLEHEQRLLDLARREANYHSPINVDHKQPGSAAPQVTIYLQRLTYCYFSGDNINRLQFHLEIYVNTLPFIVIYF